MLHLANSHAPCVPRWGNGATSSQRGFVVNKRSGQCSYCGIQAPCGMEVHVGSDGKNQVVCPLCHGCLHLRDVSYVRGGTVIWAPAITQAQLNLFTAAHVILQTAGREACSPYHQVAKVTGDIFTRMQGELPGALQKYLSNGAEIPAKSVSSLKPVDPIVLAKAIDGHHEKGSPSPRLDGLRLLYAPRLFVPLSMQSGWQSLLLDHSAIADLIAAPQEESTSSDAHEVADASPAVV